MSTLLFLTLPAWAHVPMLLPSLGNSALAGYFIGQGEISRAIFSELSESNDIAFYTFSLPTKTRGAVNILTPLCEKGDPLSPQSIPYYETFQPTALLLEGSAPLIETRESHANYLSRLRSMALQIVSSNYPSGLRPKMPKAENEHSPFSYWVGGKSKRELPPGLYTVVVYDAQGKVGNYVLGLQQAEVWNPVITDYVKAIVPKITPHFCDPAGFSGTLHLPVERVR